MVDPPVAGDGWMILGDSAGFLNSQRLKGIHLAIKSGMLAAETAFEALSQNDFSGARLASYQQRVENSSIKDELWKVRNFHQGFEHGLWAGSVSCRPAADHRWARPARAFAAIAGHRRLKKLAELPADGGAEAHLINNYKGDGKLTFDKLTDLYHSGTKHEEDQPAHLVIHDTNICNTRCVTEFGNPCQHFCPASVYEMMDAAVLPKGKTDPPESLELCALQDLRYHGDPYEIITWVPPEGGGGPNYDGM